MNADMWIWPLGRANEWPAVMWKLPATLLRISEPNIRHASDGVDGATDLKMTKKHSLFINPIKYKFQTTNI